jgi:hypothetical protein
MKITVFWDVKHHDLPHLYETARHNRHSHHCEDVKSYKGIDFLVYYLPEFDVSLIMIAGIS